jgi:hypothetical protein
MMLKGHSGNIQDIHAFLDEETSGLEKSGGLEKPIPRFGIHPFGLAKPRF